MGRVGAGPRSRAPVEAASPRCGRGGPLSAWGYVLFTGWAGSVTLLAGGWWLAGVVLVELGFGLLWGRRGLRLLLHPRVWVLILTSAALGPFVIGEPDIPLGPLYLSRAGFEAGLEMAGRALALTLAVGLGVASLSLSELVMLFERIGLRGLGFAVALAMNLLGTLQEMASVTMQTLRLRGGMRRPGLALRLFLITTVANTLRYGDEVVNAAAVRAFDPNAGRPARVPLRRADLWLFALLAGCTGVLLTAAVR